MDDTVATAAQAMFPYDVPQLELVGATILHVHPGDRLMFVIRDKLSAEQAIERIHRLQAFLPGVHIAVCDSTEQVAHMDNQTSEDAAPQLNTERSQA